MKMLRLIAVFFISVCVVKVHAQNLQFGKSKLIDSKRDTVPSGKVWKIESFVYKLPPANCPTGSTAINITDSIILNGNKIGVRAQRFTGTVTYQAGSQGVAATSPNLVIWEQKTPMWIPAGTTLSAAGGVLYINVLEFNETP